MKLHSVFADIFKQNKISIENIKIWVQLGVEQNLLKNDFPKYYQTKVIFQAHLGEQYKILLNQLLEDDFQITPINSKNLLECLEMNMCKTFIMPIYKEINSLQKLSSWK
jgi:hypothetical protein